MEFLLKSGMWIPSIGIGTYKLSAEMFFSTIHGAVKAGYKLIDTATTYCNHSIIKNLIKEQCLSEILICTKVNRHDFLKNKIITDIFNELGLHCIDIVLLHSPCCGFREKLFSLIKLKEIGKIKSIGVSNFSIHHLEAVKDIHEHIDINQVEFHVYMNDVGLLNYCKKFNIHIMAYRPFAKNIFMDDPLLIEIAKYYKKTPYQISLRWLIEKEITPIPMSSNRFHLRENYEIFDFSLSKHDISRLDLLNKNIRTCKKNKPFF